MYNPLSRQRARPTKSSPALLYIRHLYERVLVRLCMFIYKRAPPVSPGLPHKSAAARRSEIARPEVTRLLPSTYVSSLSPTAVRVLSNFFSLFHTPQNHPSFFHSISRRDCIPQQLRNSSSPFISDPNVARTSANPPIKTSLSQVCKLF